MLTAYVDDRRVIVDPHALYSGVELPEHCLLPGREAHIGALRFEDWLRHTLQPAAAP